MKKLAPWWTHYPQKMWRPIDWAEWEKAGRPEIPREMKLGHDAPLPLDRVPFAEPTETMPTFSLYPPKRRSRDAHGRAIDKLLENHLVGRR